MNFTVLNYVHSCLKMVVQTESCSIVVQKIVFEGKINNKLDLSKHNGMNTITIDFSVSFYLQTP